MKNKSEFRWTSGRIRNTLIEMKATKPLTPRQLQVLRGLCAGLVGKEIASQMGLGVRTIESHIQEAKRNLGARNIAHATFICGQRNIL